MRPSELVSRRSEGEKWQLVDVRESWELELVAVEGTIDIPMAEIPSRLDELDRELPVAVLCHSGGRSARVAGFLDQAGFKRVANVTGGIDAWAVEVDPALPRY